MVVEIIFPPLFNVCYCYLFSVFDKTMMFNNNYQDNDYDDNDNKEDDDDDNVLFQ